jgi:hypothetical protein
MDRAKTAHFLSSQSDYVRFFGFDGLEKYSKESLRFFAGGKNLLKSQVSDKKYHPLKI